MTINNIKMINENRFFQVKNASVFIIKLAVISIRFVDSWIYLNIVDNLMCSKRFYGKGLIVYKIQQLMKQYIFLMLNNWKFPFVKNTPRARDGLISGIRNWIFINLNIHIGLLLYCISISDNTLRVREMNILWQIRVSYYLNILCK